MLPYNCFHAALTKEHNLRHDWHSLLTGLNSGDIDETALFSNLVDEDRFYPKADKLAEYAEKWAERYGLNIRTSADVKAIRQAESGSGFELDVAFGEGVEEALDALRVELQRLKLKALKQRAIPLPSEACRQRESGQKQEKWQKHRRPQPLDET